MSHLKAALLALALCCPTTLAGVVFNELLYNPPEDRDDLQFVELHNPNDTAVDLSGWQLTKGVKYTFPAGARLDAQGYLVLCRDARAFKRHYGLDAAGQFAGTLDHSRGQIELIDAKGQRVDQVSYRSRAPWPVSPDGGSASLERICPTSSVAGAENWAASPLVSGPRKAGGTPGKKNSVYADRLPPIVARISFTPASATPNEAITVEAEARSSSGLRELELLFRVADSGTETEETAVRMTRAASGRYTARIPGQKAGQIVRFRVKAIDTRGVVRVHPHENDLRPALSVYVHQKATLGKLPFGLIVNVGKAEWKAAQRRGGRGYAMPPGPTPPVRSNSAFVYVDQKTGKPELFDFITIAPRTGGNKIRLHKDRPLRGMTTINLIYEHHDRFALAEHLAYEVYRKAGNVAPRSDFVRTWIDGRPVGFQLLVEQPNKAFLRHNGMRTDGNLYKCAWFGRDLIRQHEKKTAGTPGHDDLVLLVADLDKTKGEKQWELIKKQFDVEQMINYFAVNMVLSHWDGYFNNYFAYHDLNGSGKWTMYPWDQDKTWGFHDGIRGYEVFSEMPITFGMAGDRPPGWPKYLPTPPGFGFGAIWWRPGGALSKPLLANATFRRHFLARTKEIVEKVYTEEVFFPKIKELGERLEDEAKLRGKLHGGTEKAAAEQLQRNLDSLREHLKKRRAFLLAQDEIKKAGSFVRAALR